MITYKLFQKRRIRIESSQGNHQSCQTLENFGLLPERLAELAWYGLYFWSAFEPLSNTTNDSHQLQCISLRRLHKFPANLLFFLLLFFFRS